MLVITCCVRIRFDFYGCLIRHDPNVVDEVIDSHYISESLTVASALRDGTFFSFQSSTIGFDTIPSFARSPRF